MMSKLIATKDLPDNIYLNDYTRFTRSDIIKDDSPSEIKHSNVYSISGLVDVIPYTTLNNSKTVIIRSLEYPDAVALEWINPPIREIENVLSTGKTAKLDVIIYIKGKIVSRYQKGGRILIQLDSRRDPYGNIRSNGDVYYQFVPKIVVLPSPKK